MSMIVEWLSKGKVFSSIDMRDGYQCVALRRSDRYFTAVKSSMGLMQFTRMAMGLRNAGPFYQRVIGKTLGKYLWLIVVAYQDDVSVATMGEKKHAEALRNIFELFWKKTLRMKLSKCSFGVERMEGLGYEIGSNYILPKNSHRQAMESYRAPTNGSELSSFLGVEQVFARHIECAADLVAPLSHTIKGTAWNKKTPKEQ